MRLHRLILSRETERLLDLARVATALRACGWKDALALGPLILAPWAYGSDTPLSQAVLLVVFGAWLAIKGAPPHTAAARRTVVVVVGLIGLTLALVLIQYWPGGAFGYADAVWRTPGLPAHVPRIAVVAAPPLLEGLGPIATAGAVVVAALWCTDRGRFHLLIWAYAVSGLLAAVFGLVQLVLAPQALLLAERTSYFGVVTATFVNRNTAATYLGFTALLWLGILLRVWRRAVDVGALGDNLFRSMWRWPTALSLTFVALLAVAVALFLTGSRAGIIITLAVAGALIWVYLRQATSRGRIGPAVLAVAGGLAMIVIEVLGRGLEQRIARVGLTDDGRFWVFAATWTMILERPWFGVGFGGYDVAFPGYRPAEMGGFNIFRWAHSTPLEIAAEMGLPYALVVCAAVTALAAGCWARATSWPKDRSYMAAAGAGLVLAMAHSTVDFSLQVPGAAIPVLALAAAAMALPERSGER